MKYKDAAKIALAKAKKELNCNEDIRLPYAALELRMALEALIYEKALLYTEELSGKKLSTWQPKALLLLLLEIDPYADKESTFSIGQQEGFGLPAREMRVLGTEHALSLSEVKKYYDKLGSYLHTPTSDQIANNKTSSPQKIRQSCEELCKIIERVLSSTITNSTFKVKTSLDCQNCGKKIVRRIPSGMDTLVAKCIECSATYELKRVGRQQIEWKPIFLELKCVGPSCGRIVDLYEFQYHQGAFWICLDCKGRNEISLGVAYTPA